MKSILFLLLSVFLCGCEYGYYDAGKKEILVNEIMNKVSSKMKKEQELYPFGNGAQMMYEIKMLALSFDYYKPVSIEEGRKLLVAVMNNFLQEVNTDDRIRPFLSNYPFTSENIQIDIVVRNLDYSSFGPEELIVLDVRHGVFRYEINDPEGKLFKTIHSETYEEALARLDDSSANLLVVDKQAI